jgi:hypothetical protein
MTAVRIRDRKRTGDRPDEPRTDATPAIEIREDGDRMNVLVETDDAALLLAWDDSETAIDELLDVLDDCERELRQQVQTAPAIERLDGEGAR